MRYFILTLMVLFVASVPALAADAAASLEKELQKLEAELPDILSEETELDVREKYVDRILKLRSKIEALEDGTDVAENETETEDRILIFKGFYLYEDGEYISHPYAGKTVTQCAYNECGKKIDTRTRTLINTYPLRIEPGKPFSISVSVEAEKVKHEGMYLEDWDTKAVADISYGAYDGPSLKVRQTSEPLDYDYGYKGTFNASTKSSVTLDFDYEGYDRETSYAGTYEYKLSKVRKEGEFSSAAAKKDPTGEMQRMDYNDKEEKGDKSHQYGFKFTVNGLTAIYDWGAMDDKPADVQALPKEDPLVAEEAENQSETENTAQENQSEEKKDPLQLAENMMNETLINDPKERKKHIKYWIKNADPLENARPGSNLKYEKWGRIEGKVNGLGTIVVSGKPDDAEGWFPDPYEYVWAKADTLDSLNLCTLRAYVERKLTNKETETCKKDAEQMPAIASENSVPGLISRQAKRYVIMPDVVGMSFKKASKKLSKQGLQALVGETYKPNSKGEAGKVISQQTISGSKVEKDTDVFLNIAIGDNKVDMPNLLGMPYDEAARYLRAMGLKPKYVEGPYPHKPDLSEKVLKTSLTPPIKVSIGVEIEVTAYKKYVAEKAPSEPTPSYTSNWGRPSKQPNEEKVVKSDSGFSFGSLNRESSDTGTFKCETGMGHIPVEETGKLYPKRKNGVLETDELGMKNYICRYQMKGKSQVAQIAFFDKEPIRKDAKDMKARLCGKNAMYHDLNRAKPLTVYLAKGYSWSNIGTDAEIERFINLHVDQIASKAISCGGNSSTASTNSPEQPPAKTGGTPSQFKCNARFGLSVDSSATQNGVVSTGISGEKKYECHYTVQGKKRTVRVEFFDTPQPISKSYLKNQFCQNFKYSYPALTQSIAIQMVGANITAAVGEKNVIPFYKFHVDQLAPYAIPCN